MPPARKAEIARLYAAVFPTMGVTKPLSCDAQKMLPVKPLDSDLPVEY